MQRNDIALVETLIKGAIKKDDPFDSAPLENKIKGFEGRLKALEAAVKDMEAKKEIKK